MVNPYLIHITTAGNVLHYGVHRWWTRHTMSAPVYSDIGRHVCNHCRLKGTAISVSRGPCVEWTKGSSVVAENGHAAIFEGSVHYIKARSYCHGI